LKGEIILSNEDKDLYFESVNSLIKFPMSTILISEAYYGKNPLLIQIENEVEYIRKQCLNDFNYNPNFTKENKKIEQYLPNYLM